MDKLAQIFEQINSEVLTDDVKLQMEVLFESAVNEAIVAEKERLEKESKEYLQKFEEKVLSAIDDYTSEYIKDFIKENENAIVDTVKVKKAEEVLKTFNNMVEQFNIEISEKTNDEKINESVKNEEMKEKLNKVIEEKLQLEKELIKIKKEQMINEFAETITIDSIKEKFKKLAESLEYESNEEFKEKLSVLKESISVKKEDIKTDKDEKTKKLTEEIEDNETKSTDEDITKYMQYF